jgi:hypothetical protein
MYYYHLNYDLTLNFCQKKRPLVRPPFELRILLNVKRLGFDFLVKLCKEFLSTHCAKLAAVA